MSNKMLSTATPGFNDVIKQSPELMKMFSSAAVDTMSKQNSAFDFAKNMMNPPDEINTKHGPPPAPMETQNRPPPQRPGAMNFTPHSGNRPDLAAAQGPMFQERGINITSNQQSTQRPAAPVTRPEMRGPQTSPDLDQLLSGLKSKKPETIPVSAPSVETLPPVAATVPMSTMSGAESIISVSSLKDLDGTTLPKKTRRRQNTSKSNTVALDI
jgi:hypothetical protein